MAPRCPTVNNILIIDDEPDVRAGIRRVLERAGYSAHTVESPPDAMLTLRSTPIDLVITDIIMPKLNGVHAIAQILREFPAVKIIAISGGGNFDVSRGRPAAVTTIAHLAAATDAGAHCILTKPFESRELLQAVAELLGDGST